VVLGKGHSRPYENHEKFKVNRSFGDIYCLHLQGWGVSQARNQLAEGTRMQTRLYYESIWLEKPGSSWRLIVKAPISNLRKIRPTAQALIPGYTQTDRYDLHINRYFFCFVMNAKKVGLC
jgi:hypothetical protein